MMQRAKVNFELLNKLLQDNKEAVRKALELFVETTVEDMDQLGHCIHEARFLEASRIAHSLKSRFVYLGNDDTNVGVRTLEGLLKDARTQTQHEIERLFTSLNKLVNLCLKEVKEEIKGLNG